MAKLTNEQKIEIYERKLKGESLRKLGQKFKVNFHRLEYLVRVLKKHGYRILEQGKNNHYSKEVKESTINRVLLNNEAILSVALDVGLSSDGQLINWIKKYKENFYNVIENNRGKS